MKGTVIGPVVTPPESNASGTNSLGTKYAIINDIIQRNIIIYEYFNWNNILNVATTKNIPTPIPMV